MMKKGIGLRDKLNLLSIGLVVLTAIGIATFVVHREITTRYHDLVNTGLTTAAMIASAKPQCSRKPSTMRGRRASGISAVDFGQPMPIGSFIGPSRR